MGLPCVSKASSGTSCIYGGPIRICGDLWSEDDAGAGHDVIHCLHMTLDLPVDYSVNIRVFGDFSSVDIIVIANLIKWSITAEKKFFLPNLK
jgi:hypothetical protein